MKRWLNQISISMFMILAVSSTALADGAVYYPTMKLPETTTCVHELVSLDLSGLCELNDQASQLLADIRKSGPNNLAKLIGAINDLPNAAQEIPEFASRLSTLNERLDAFVETGAFYSGPVYIDYQSAFRYSPLLAQLIIKKTAMVWAPVGSSMTHTKYYIWGRMGTVDVYNSLNAIEGVYLIGVATQKDGEHQWDYKVRPTSFDESVDADRKIFAQVLRATRLMKLSDHILKNASFLGPASDALLDVKTAKSDIDGMFINHDAGPYVGTSEAIDHYFMGSMMTSLWTISGSYLVQP